MNVSHLLEPRDVMIRYSYAVPGVRPLIVAEYRGCAVPENFADVAVPRVARTFWTGAPGMR